jgi:hypothetical protein
MPNVIRPTWLSSGIICSTCSTQTQQAAPALGETAPEGSDSLWLHVATAAVVLVLLLPLLLQQLVVGASGWLLLLCCYRWCHRTAMHTAAPGTTAAGISFPCCHYPHGVQLHGYSAAAAAAVRAAAAASWL